MLHRLVRAASAAVFRHTAGADFFVKLIKLSQFFALNHHPRIDMESPLRRAVVLRSIGYPEQKGACDITAWREWSLSCLPRAIEELDFGCFASLLFAFFRAGTALVLAVGVKAGVTEGMAVRNRWS